MPLSSFELVGMLKLSLSIQELDDILGSTWSINERGLNMQNIVY